MTELAFVDRGARVAIRGLLLFFWTLRCCPLMLACGTLAIPVSATDAGRDVHTRSAKKHCISSAICSVPPLLVQRRAALANRTVSGIGNETRLGELLNATNDDARRGVFQDILRHAPNWTHHLFMPGHFNFSRTSRTVMAISFNTTAALITLGRSSQPSPIHFLIIFVVCTMVLSVCIAVYLRWERSPSQRREAQTEPLRRSVRTAPAPGHTPSLLTSPCGSPSYRDCRNYWLCPSLVVPSGIELVFAVSELITAEKQQVSFHIVDLQGQPLSRVVVDEFGSRGGIFLRSLDDRPLAWVKTASLYDAQGGAPPQICWPSGEVYGSIAKEDPVPNKRYTLRDKAGQRIFTYNGNFQEKAINVVSASGRLVCDTERCVAASLGNTPHFQVRVAPSVDAGLVLCGLLAIDKLRRAS